MLLVNKVQEDGEYGLTAQGLTCLPRLFIQR
jgi:hypothetical protein